MSYENYLEAYNDFWELKEKYDKKERKAIKTLKKKHPNNIPLVKEELQKFRDRRKCVNCNKVGGTVFEITKTHLKAYCNATKKCNLNIDLKKAKHDYLPDLIKEKVKVIEDIKQDILVYKLDILFQTQSEEVVLKEFRRLKEILNDSISEKDLYQELYDKKNKILELDGETENNFVLKKNYIETKEKELNKLVSEFKKYMMEYKKTNDRSILVNNLDIYKNTILPLQDEIRNLKFNEILIEQEEVAKKSRSNLKLMPRYVVKKVKENFNSKTQTRDFKVIKNKK